MSLAELLPAGGTLPKAKQLRLRHLPIDGIAEVPTPSPADAANDIPRHLRAMFPPGVTLDVWSPEQCVAEGFAVSARPVPVRASNAQPVISGG